MRLRRKRELTMQWRPIQDTQPETTTTPEEIENHIRFTERAVKLGMKTILLGAAVVYGYVLMDTFRQVSVEHAKHQPGSAQKEGA